MQKETALYKIKIPFAFYKNLTNWDNAENRVN